jgi:hypothetical protein
MTYLYLFFFTCSFFWSGFMSVRYPLA